MPAKANTKASLRKRRPKAPVARGGLAARLRKLRGDRSNRAFAKQVHVNSARMSDWLSGRVDPSAHNLLQIAKHTGCSVDWLLGLSDLPFREQSRTSTELSTDVATYLVRSVARAVGMPQRMLVADGARALKDMAQREADAFTAKRKWNDVFASVITSKFLDRQNRPQLESPEWNELRNETVEALRFGAGAGPPAPGNVTIGLSRKA